MRRLFVEAPAKINLTLRVLDRRADGFHELDTVFQTIDLSDTLELQPADGVTVTTDHPELQIDETNLAQRAALLLREAAECDQGVAIHLRKRIPLGGGLGGGSSDAAATLLGCTRLWELDLGLAELESVARRLGADVPFFLHGGTARGTARGDRITRLEPFGERPLVLGMPPFAISTAEVFERASGWLTLPSNSVNFPALFGHKWRQPNDLGLLDNDLQEVVFEARPELRRFRERLLDEGASVALMSGSGSTVFGMFDEANVRDAALATLGEAFGTWNLVPSKTVNEGIRVDVA
ncbi:MAG: 4-(cytidine 5'-diphospho)-2-C-methyl-D-erythritol kinase [Acidobacteria bacterium]|nr:4-(cytidine 5'-diphospho)-2-C-methyl-D-erythritol kinase [Acidobacteriota bacterium]NIM61017.1 4-(cytidine 5'-diphospho)-2-C-methyl-D-erythritol kinase [Acidobacteriota bacterium]NIO59985.1 4-(cytidine 5'-diphospho)-2-C-methyl-D-erythritol kinase [Acidobacteriota bacterium]NIQ31057.1 4-(cytidine 5'-diphospho)-2-C-methyl-D-erythritol kinase [Acidobacteriota bacterium]NIQ86185.1 4-(cytidine 5'-diphospho)-2-C-methyl-D-erythritol kinase [Acidobacteriota bacterium]